MFCDHLGALVISEKEAQHDWEELNTGKKTKSSLVSRNHYSLHLFVVFEPIIY